MPPKSKLGQNFLRDQQAIRRIVAALGDRSDRTVVEIGPGMGAITRELAAKAGRVLALEYDRDLASRLMVELSGSETKDGSASATSNVEIKTVDVLSFDFAAAASSANQRLIVAGNLPYYITSPSQRGQRDSSQGTSLFICSRAPAFGSSSPSGSK